MSVARYTREIAEYEAAHDNSVRGYAGLAYADWWVGDIDRATPAEALAATRALVHTLIDRFDVRPDQLRPSYTGGDGFHIALATHLFGAVEPSPHVHLVLSEIAKTFSEASGVELDRARYRRLALLRVVDTQHPRPTRIGYAWKTAITWGELIELSAREIDALARRPRPRRLPYRPHDLEPIPALEQVYDAALDAAHERANRPPPTLRWWAPRPRGRTYILAGLSHPPQNWHRIQLALSQALSALVRVSRSM